MSDRAFAWATVAAAGTHLAGLVSASALLGPVGTALTPSPTPIPVEILAEPPVAPAPAEELAPPRATGPLAPDASVADPVALPHPLLEPPASPALSMPAPGPAPASPSRDLLAGSRTVSALLPRPSAPGGVADTLLAPPGSPGQPAVGALLDDGGVPIAAGGVPGGQGEGLAARGPTGPGPLASVIDRAGRGGIGVGVGALDTATLAVPTAPARPLGGTRAAPQYPESVRRLGIQGTTVLRLEVLPSGRVGQVRVDRSAGHPDLDQAAVDAVRDWRFEPARRGTVPVTMWVSQPIRFELK